MATIQKIRSLELENFKGFIGTREKPINTDADIVLITGANGYGKTSLLEALTAILTGYHPYGEDPVNALIPVWRFNSSDGCMIRINADISPDPDEAAHLKTFTISWGDSGKVTERRGTEMTIQQRFPRPDGFPPFLTGTPQQYELHARLCAFFQERVTFQFDQGARGDTVRDVINPVPVEISRVIGKLEEFTGQDGIPSQVDKLQRYSSPKSPEEIRQELIEKSGTFMTLYNEIADWRGNEWASGPSTFDRGDTLNEFVRRHLEHRGLGISYGSDSTSDSDLAGNFVASLKRSLNEWVKDAGKRALGETDEGRELQRRLDTCEARINTIEATHPKLADEVALFEPSSPQQGCDALTLLRTLAANARRWASVQLPDSEDQKQERLHEIRAEFGRVDENRATTCVKILENWYGRRKALWYELSGLRAEKEVLDQERARFSSSEEVDAAKRISRELPKRIENCMPAWKTACQREREIANYNLRMEQAAALERHNQAAVALLNAFEEKVKLADEQFDALSSAVREVAKRFSMVEGMLPRKTMEVVQRRRRDETSEWIQTLQFLKTEDGREMVHFSTGQKAQLGISLLVAQNLHLSKFLPHRVLLLDDLTTAYDLANLSREAILWRQLAYGRKAGDPLARQVFISTHHEELTNKLLELLVPPAGRSLRVIKFCGYSKEKGPEIELYNVEPTAPSESSQALAMELRNLSSPTI